MAERPFRFPSEQLRLKAQAEQESAEGVKWVPGVSAPLGRRISALVDRCTDDPSYVWSEADRLRQLGTMVTTEKFVRTHYILNGVGTDIDRVDAVAALGFVFDSAEEYGSSGGDGTWYIRTTMLRPSLFIDATNDLLLENRVEWEWFDHQLSPRGNRALHAEVVEPTVELLDSDPSFEHANRAYGQAFTAIGKGETARALVLLNTALQDFLRALGATTNTASASTQVDELVKAGRLTQWDRKLLKPFTDWVTADRSQSGEAHTLSGKPEKEDVFLMAHVVGAVIVRLSTGKPRA